MTPAGEFCRSKGKGFMDINEIRERMRSGKLYECTDSVLQEQQRQALELLYEYNSARPSETGKKSRLLRLMFAEVGDDCYIEAPLWANWGGKNVHLGSGVYANFNLTLVDDGEIFIGDHVMLGPGVTLCTAAHPISPPLRLRQVQYNLPVRICSNVWLGGNVFVLPGVTIGENSVIGAGSVVTKDIPANVVAAGVPCRIMRSITEDDLKFYDHGKIIEGV